MSSKPMRETIGYLMVLVSRAHRNLVSAALADLGLYLGQEILLMYLWEKDGLTQSELVERMEIEPPTLTKMLNRMERSGLLERCRCPEDARSYRVFLTEGGRVLQEPVTQLWHDFEQRILTDFTLEEQLLFRRLLLQVRSNLG
ncbi:MAG: MarR family transcriptional regulator [Chlorogloeopsis fritschii C42_A2020_084]|uniref:MarR family winged helix-turn-helix transcriptional regulator n=1 Tax=Chlorogloeopsis fritschii TaxID=1124 RepID=UPI0019F97EF3|nr:MarR family transcriptional regulator [Chlorogloeopsis fritschii]MBF2006609.1 MarR family transcriptional regulator [Chlorogloeopsis fritschii C42_A2020_084]